jgi:hypothetical protein
MDALTALISAFEALLAHAHFLSIALGMVIASSAAQWAKFPIRRWFIRTIAGLVAFLVTFATWPDPSLAWKVVWSLTTAALTPITYQVITHYVPWLGERMTADRGLAHMLERSAAEPARQDDTQ